jgi:rhodanese-related sulfurtransferase
VIQEYIEKPLLIEQYKFDIRIWVLLKIIREKGPDNINRKKLKVFYCQHGYSRIASAKYEEDDKDEPIN